MTSREQTKKQNYQKFPFGTTNEVKTVDSITFHGQNKRNVGTIKPLVEIANISKILYIN